jgi:hypothetical protein
VHFKDSNSLSPTYMYGFILMAKGQMIEFFVKNDRVLRDEWISAFRFSVVLLDLKEDFDIFDLLGRGNFAKVHLCKRRRDINGQNYALKTIDKKLIK